MVEELTCVELMERLCKEDVDARVTVFEKYWQGVIEQACQKLKWRVKEAVEPANVALSVLSSFFEKHAEDDIDLQQQDGVWGLLVEITGRHCEKWNKRFRAKKRRPEGGVLRIDGNTSNAARGREDLFEHEDVEAPKDLIDEADYLAHLLYQLNNRLNERQRQVIALHLSGLTNNEVSQAMGITKSRVDHLCLEIRKIARQEIKSPLNDRQRQILAHYVVGKQPHEIAELLSLTAEYVRDGLETIRNVARSISKDLQTAFLQAGQEADQEVRDRLDRKKQSFPGEGN